MATSSIGAKEYSWNMGIHSLMTLRMGTDEEDDEDEELDEAVDDNKAPKTNWDGYL